MPKKEYLPWPRKIRSGQSLVTVYRLDIKGVRHFQVRWMQDGRVHRSTTQSERDAISFAEVKVDELAAGETGAVTLAPKDAAAYATAATLCGSVALDAAVSEWAEAKRRLGSTPLLHAVDDYIARHRGESIPLNEAVEQFLVSRKDVSEIYVDRLRRRLKFIKEAFGARRLSEITEQEIRAFVDKRGGSPRTRKNNRDAIVSVWRWARTAGFLPRDMQTEAERVETPNIKRKKRIPIFSCDEMKKLLTAAFPHIRPLLAISGFAGVRSLGELSRLQWEDVKWDRGVLDVAGKTGEHRFVPIQPNLAAWLEPFKGCTGPIATVQPHKAFQRTAKTAGIKWKTNALRHSYGSYRVATTKSVDQTSLEMGNSPVMVRRHYLEAVHEDEAKEWFGIMPPGATAPNNSKEEGKE